MILKRDDGTVVGRCDFAMENDGWDWVCRQLHIKIPAGTYEIDVSDRASWSYVSESGKVGFGWVRGYLASEARSSTPWALGK